MKNCPQCDDIPVIAEVEDGMSVLCEFCNYQTRGFPTEYEAVEAWNEVHDIVVTRSETVAIALSRQPKDKVKQYMRLGSLRMIAEYLQICHDNNDEWATIKGELYKQVKVAELSYDRIRKKIKEIRANKH